MPTAIRAIDAATSDGRAWTGFDLDVAPVEWFVAVAAHIGRCGWVPAAAVAQDGRWSGGSREVFVAPGHQGKRDGVEV